jgi:hypothetical protein
MSNKTLIPIIIILSLITIGVASLTQFSKVPNKVGVNSSSEIVSSDKSQVFSSSSLVQIANSSSVASSAQKVVESDKIESQAVVSNTINCNLPESETLVKTEDGCFNIAYSVGPNTFFKWENMDPNIEPNFYLLYNSESNVKIAKEIAKDFFVKFKEKVVIEDSKYYTQLNIGSVNRKGDVFTINTYISNQVIGENNAKILLNIIGEYEIYKGSDEIWRWKFIKQIN